MRVQRGADGADVLTVPDFSGNFMFNTLGNLAVHPRAGLLFIDFARGDRLHLAVDASVTWQGDELAAFAGAQRLMRFRVREAVRVSGAARLAWSEPLLSPFLQATGSWEGIQG